MQILKRLPENKEDYNIIQCTCGTKFSFTNDDFKTTFLIGSPHIVCPFKSKKKRCKKIYYLHKGSLITMSEYGFFEEIELL
jgi:hypothetical protein